MPADLRALLRDLAAETVALDAIIGPLDEAVWRCPTPAVGWTIADQGIMDRESEVIPHRNS